VKTFYPPQNPKKKQLPSQKQPNIPEETTTTPNISSSQKPEKQYYEQYYTRNSTRIQHLFSWDLLFKAGPSILHNTQFVNQYVLHPKTERQLINPELSPDDLNPFRTTTFFNNARDSSGRPIGHISRANLHQDESKNPILLLLNSYNERTPNITIPSQT
jgi:hypothetical protein